MPIATSDRLVLASVMDVDVVLRNHSKISLVPRWAFYGYLICILVHVRCTRLGDVNFKFGFAMAVKFGAHDAACLVDVPSCVPCEGSPCSSDQ